MSLQLQQRLAHLFSTIHKLPEKSRQQTNLYTGTPPPVTQESTLKVFFNLVNQQDRVRPRNFDALETLI